jgi:ribose 5-phosphate isomerase A
VTGHEDANELKRAAADAAAATLEDGQIVGLGSGSTAMLAVHAIADRVRGGLRITGIATSEETARMAGELGIPLSTLDEHARIDVTIDGADEVELGTLHLIKGRGGALLREKIVASASGRLIVVVDESKLVERLGIRDTVPVEVVPFGWRTTEQRLRRLGAGPVLRVRPDGGAYLTDGGHYILDCAFDGIADAGELGDRLDQVVGVVEHGLFIGMTSQVIIGTSAGLKILQALRSI